MRSINKLYTGGLLVLAALGSFSCRKEKGKDVAIETTDFSNRSFIQFYNATVGAARTYLYVDGAAVTGATVPYGNGHPSTTTPANFAIPSGLHNIIVRDTLPNSSQPIMSLAQNLGGSYYYSLYSYDTFTSPKNKMVLSNIVVPDDTTARLRFANFLYSPNAIPAFDVYSRRLGRVVFSNVPTAGVTDYIPYDSRRADTLVIREAGSSVDMVNRTITNGVTTLVTVQLPITLTRKRSYTLLFRGGYRADVTGQTTLRTLTLQSNN